MRKTLLATVALSALILAGCGTAASNSAAAKPAPTTSPTQTTNQAANSASSSASDSNQASNSSQTSDSSSQALKAQEIDLTVLPGGRFATADGKMHDTFSQTDINVIQGVPVKLTVYNYDSGEHSITAGDLGLNLQAKGSTKNGVPGVTTVTFTPSKAGNFAWQCIDKCDGGMTSYSMTHDGYMKGTIHVLPQSTDKQYIDLTIKDGLQYAAADGKLHDSYSPADFTVQAGIPVVMTVTNFDTGDHSMFSSGLGLSQVWKGATKEGVPTVTTYTFTPTKTGSFKWQCTIKCDGGMTSYAMTHDGYMMGTINVVS